MALKLPFEFKGIQADYWKITAVNEDFIESKTQVQVSLYASAEARAKDPKNVLFSIEPAFVIPGVDLTRSQIYEKLRELDIFKSAQNI